jgi:predicted O-methyltransferase YrrM
MRKLFAQNPVDAEKDVYSECYKAVIPKLVKGGLLIAANVISHRET